MPPTLPPLQKDPPFPPPKVSPYPYAHLFSAYHVSSITDIRRLEPRDLKTGGVGIWIGEATSPPQALKR